MTVSPTASAAGSADDSFVTASASAAPHCNASTAVSGRQHCSAVRGDRKRTGGIESQ